MDSPMPTALYEAGIHGPGWQGEGAMILPEHSLCYGLPPTQLGASQVLGIGLRFGRPGHLGRRVAVD